MGKAVPATNATSEELKKYLPSHLVDQMKLVNEFTIQGPKSNAIIDSLKNTETNGGAKKNEVL